MSMALKDYIKKRNLKETPEPPAKKKKSEGKLRFCIQKHAARRLHYDFRLEYKGVLLSWAVPKNLSVDPKDKRLAIQVEDHPIDYQYFEGEIPKGHYGAGKVEIWDHGTYTTHDLRDNKEIEKEITKGIEKGHFSVTLHGEKLNGTFVFQKLKKDDEKNEWLVFKKEDSFSVSEEPIKSKKKSKLPEFIEPMLATLVDEPLDSDEWLFEIKWDGFRVLAFVDENTLELKSRNKLSFNLQFPIVVKDLKKIKEQVIFDGEIVALDENGKSNFQLLQNYQTQSAQNLCYYVFDILFLEGRDLRELPLIERKEILKTLLDKYSLNFVRYSDHILKNGISFFKEAVKNNLEGIIGKKIGSSYVSKRSKEWIKIKSSLRQEVVIGGFTEPRGSREKFGSLLVGVYNKNNELVYAGHVGGGFNFNLLNDVHKKLSKLVQKNCPFKIKPKANSQVTWVKPQLLCEVSFAEWTKDNLMRQPIFQGLREDKKAKEVKKEVPIHIKKEKKDPDEFELTNLDKVYWPKEKITKGELIKYYEQMSPYILPYLKDRPIMLHRYPNGIEKPSFYQKDISYTPPEGINLCPIQHEGKVDHYLLVNNLKSLLYAINLGSIDLHPFISRYQNVETPDFCLIDLDPHNIDFSKVVEAAQLIHEILTDLNIKHYCKTSGGNGLHIFIPLHGKYDFDQSRQFAEILCYFINKQLPKTTSLERNPKKREKKIYLDCLQNRRGQTVVPPYIVRPRPMALVSTPLTWEEVNNNLNPAKFNMKSIIKRVDEIGDIFKFVLKETNNLKKALKALEKYL